jgi:hypothetical protein
MAAERVAAELELLGRAYPDLEFRAEGHWVRIPRYALPDGIWHRSETEVCFQIPESIPAQGPYGFYVRPGLALRDGTPIDNYTYPATTGFGDDWGKFSWQLLVWAPKEEIVAGTNMVNFARSIGDRLREGR